MSLTQFPQCPAEALQQEDEQKSQQHGLSFLLPPFLSLALVLTSLSACSSLQGNSRPWVLTYSHRAHVHSPSWELGLYAREGQAPVVCPGRHVFDSPPGTSLVSCLLLRGSGDCGVCGQCCSRGQHLEVITLSSQIGHLACDPSAVL